jgi:hypothetical protein
VKRKFGQEKKLMKIKAEEDKERKKINLRRPVQAITATATGAGIGVMGAITGVAIAAAFKVALPVALCLWAGGVTFGAVGLTVGMGRKKKIEKQ